MKPITLCKCAAVILLVLILSGGLSTTPQVLAQADIPDDTTAINSLAQPQSLPVLQVTTDPATDAMPAFVQTAGGKLLAVFVRAGNLWSRISTDAGATWADEVRIDGCCRFNPSLMRAANDNTLWLIYDLEKEIVVDPPGYAMYVHQIWYRTSADDGVTWSEERQGGAAFDPDNPHGEGNSTVFQAPDGKLWIVWSSYHLLSGNSTVWYKISADGGATWSTPAQITSDGYASSGTAASGGRVVVIFNRGDGELWQRSTSDDGRTWSTETRIAGCCRNDPSVTAIGAGLWLAYENDEDIWYRTSANQGTTWSIETPFTRFVGRDSDVTVALVDGEPAYAWSSTRSGNPDIWFGNLDDNPPPYVEWIEHRPSCNLESDDIITFRALARDEIGVTRVQLAWTLDGIAQADLPMYDDGSQGDDEAGDGVWGVRHEALPAGSQVTYTACATDTNGNNYCHPSQGSFTVQPPFTKTANILFVPDRGGSDTSDFRSYYTRALDAQGYTYDIWDTGRRCAPDSASLDQYTTGTVIWAVPYSGFITDHSDVRIAVQSYLVAGGKLFITGQKIAYATQGTPFLQDYLHASYVQFDPGLRTVNGMGLKFDIAGGDGADNQWFPDEVDPIDPAEGIFIYTAGAMVSNSTRPKEETTTTLQDVHRKLTPDVHGGRPEPEGFTKLTAGATATPAGCIGSCTAGVHVKTNGYSVVYLSFGFEAINSATSRNCVMGHALDLLNDTPLRPCLLSPADGQVVPPGDVAFNWTSVPGATSYEIQIEPDGIMQTVSGTGYTHRFTVLGTRNWRVRASGGEWTPYSSFAVSTDVVQVTTDQADDATPALVQMGDSSLLTVLMRNGALWSSASTDGGATWAAEQQIAGCCRYNPSLVRATDGTLWLVYDYNDNIWYRTSANLGVSWSPERQLTTDPVGNYSPAVFQAADGKLWVVWYSYRADWTSIWYKFSANAGATWSADAKLSTSSTSSGSYRPTATSTPDNHIVVIWESYGGLWQRSSSDGGATWAEQKQIDGCYNPSLAHTTDGTLWLACERDGDIWYRTSVDQGANWSDEVRLTHFAGTDTSVALAALTPNKLGFVWSSTRSGNPDIWFGALDDREDLNPPPYIEWIDHQPTPNPDSDDTIIFRARAMDETGVASVHLVWTLNGVAQEDLQMFDDGAHDDYGSGDGVWGVRREALPEGSQVSYRAQAMDVIGNSYRFPSQNSFKVLAPFIKTAAILFVPDAGTNRPNDTTWFQPYYTDALDALGLRYDIWDTEFRGEPDSAILNQYTRGMVIWAVPYQGYATGYSRSTEQLRTYLDGGGNLFITGQNIADGLGWTSFLRDYLHATYRQGDTGLFALAGASGDPIGDGMTLNISGGDGANNQYSKDEIDPIAPAEVVLTYQAGASAMLAEPSGPTQKAPASRQEASRQPAPGVPLQDASARPAVPPTPMPTPTAAPPVATVVPIPTAVPFPTPPAGNVSSGTAGLHVDTGVYKVVYFAFGFEAINNAADRNTVMERVVDWLKITSAKFYLPLVIKGD